MENNGFTRRQPNAAWFILNASKASQNETEFPEDYSKTVFRQTMDLLSKGSDFRITPLGILIQREMAWGPFEKKAHAEYMIPSILDDDGRDWKGEKWGISQLPMIFEDFEMPNYQVRRVYWCKHCNGAQPFKGSCSICKSNHSVFRKTIEIKDWENEL